MNTITPPTAVVGDDYDPDLDPELYDDGEDYCCHEDAELDWEGHFECHACGHRWYATEAEMTSYWAAYERAHRPPTIGERVTDAWAALKYRMREWLSTKQSRETDDDIPF